MKSPDSTIRTSIYNAIGAITYSGSTVTLLSGIPENPTYPYILIANQSNSETQNKDPYFFDHDVLIEVVTGFVGGSASKGPADTISNDITQAMVNIVGDSTFKIEGVRLDFTDYLIDDDGRYKIIRKLMRFNLQLQQI